MSYHMGAAGRDLSPHVAVHAQGASPAHTISRSHADVVISSLFRNDGQPSPQSAFPAAQRFGLRPHLPSQAPVNLAVTICLTLGCHCPTRYVMYPEVETERAAQAQAVSSSYTTLLRATLRLC